MTSPSVGELAEEESGTGLVSEERTRRGRSQAAIDDIGLVSPPAHACGEGPVRGTARDRSETVKMRSSRLLRFRAESQETRRGSQQRRPAADWFKASSRPLDLEPPAIGRIRQARQADRQYLRGAATASIRRGPGAAALQRRGRDRRRERQSHRPARCPIGRSRPSMRTDSKARRRPRRSKRGSSHPSRPGAIGPLGEVGRGTGDPDSEALVATSDRPPPATLHCGPSQERPAPKSSNRQRLRGSRWSMARKSPVGQPIGTEDGQDAIRGGPGGQRRGSTLLPSRVEPPPKHPRDPRASVPIRPVRRRPGPASPGRRLVENIDRPPSGRANRKAARISPRTRDSEPSGHSPPRRFTSTRISRHSGHSEVLSRTGTPSESSSRLNHRVNAFSFSLANPDHDRLSQIFQHQLPGFFLSAHLDSRYPREMHSSWAAKCPQNIRSRDRHARCRREELPHLKIRPNDVVT